MQYFIKEDYYFDIDNNHQFRITGPENHLLLGFQIHNQVNVEINSFELESDQLVIDATFDSQQLEISQPLVADIRTLRSYVESTKPRPTYQDLADRQVVDLLPTKIEERETDTETQIAFNRQYEDQFAGKQFYGAILEIPSTYSVERRDNRIIISSFGSKRKNKQKISLKIRTISNIHVESRINGPLFSQIYFVEPKYYSQFILDLYAQLERDISFLVRNRRTSSFEYGTIFPRDWIESACLGSKDLDQTTVDFMIAQSLKHVSDDGEGWHEDVVGEFKTRVPEDQQVDRKMIDIEPLYLIGINYVSKQFLFSRLAIDKLRAIAKFVANTAVQKSLITFKQQPGNQEYYQVGNWRDSLQAFPNQLSPVAPYDVNCVFYPLAIRQMITFAPLFPDLDSDLLEQALQKWDKNKAKFMMYHPDEVIGMALALHGRKNLPLPVSHLDESYDLFFGYPSMEEVYSFAIKVLDPDYFYTPVGPILVAADTVGLSEKNYHGKVIWPKQAAFTVAGLSRQFKRGMREGWPRPFLQQISESARKTSEACFRGWEELGSVPEVYFYDQEKDRARYFTDQEDIEGQMSLIQLWSAVGARRIIHEYRYLMANKIE